MWFAQVLEDVSTWVTANLPIVIGGAVAIAVLTGVFFYTRPRRVSPTEKLAAAAAAAASSTQPKHALPTSEEKALNWDPPEQSYADRRGAVRRDGRLIRVQLVSPAFRDSALDAFVLDRSTGGLRLAVSTEIATGTTVQVRPVNAPDIVGFITVIVRSCRKNAEFFELGCEFEKTPPWNVLLLFG
jgi:PilZ domain